MVFALPGEPGLTELTGDFKVHFHDQKGDFYFWLNTTMTENRKTMNTRDIDWFDKRKLPSPGFQVEVVLVDCADRPPPVPSPPPPPASESETATHKPDESSNPIPDRDSESQRTREATSSIEVAKPGSSSPETKTGSVQVESMTHEPEQISVAKESYMPTTPGYVSGLEVPDSGMSSEFKLMAADASVFTFGDEDDCESD